MKKLFGLLVLLAISVCTNAQDVIVKKDGSTILSKVLEVTPNIIKYKKQSNLDGPTYTMNLSDVLSVNYANGEKEIFNEALQTSNQEKNANANQEDYFINDGIISEYNDRTVISKLKNSKKQAKWVYRLLKVHPSSVAGNSNGRLHITTKQTKDLASTVASFCLSIENTSNEMMYVDLGSSTFRQLKSANTYYLNSSTTTSKSSNGGASVNMGSIASILGVGGALGTLASGTTVGGGKSSGTSTTVYAERIITIPPHSVYNLKAKDFYNSMLVNPYKKDFLIGDRFNYPYPEDPKDTPWEFIVSYAMENDLNEMKKLDLYLYIAEEISVEASWDKCFEKPSGFTPIHYYYRVK